MTRVSVAVMAHPSRAALVGPLVERLGISPDMVSWDTDGVRWHTGRRAWEMADPAADWHVVIQDDALVCLDLPAALEVALDHVPLGDAIVSLYVGRRRPLATSVENAVVAANAHGAAWIRMRALNWGVAIGAPTESIPGMLAWCDRQVKVPQYDMRVGRYYRDIARWPTWCAHPAMVDHRADVGSLCGHGGGRVAHQFIGEDRSALDVDWSAGHVDMDGLHKLWRARARRDRSPRRAARGTMIGERRDLHAMTSTDPFRPASTARRVFVDKAEQPAEPAPETPPAEVAEPQGVVGAGFIDPGATPDPRHDEFNTAEAPALVPRSDQLDVVDEPVVTDEVERPKANDSKDAWVAYARAQGDPDADTLTKAQLRQRYG